VLGSRAGWHLDVRYGPVGRVIAEAAREWGASLIVVGSGSHRAVNRLLGEEVSLQVIRHASCPVLAVAPTRDVPLRRAVVGIDFSAASFRAALTALALLDLDDGDPALDVHGVAMLSLVHVRSPFEHEYPILGSFAAAYDADIAARFTRLREYLRPYAGGRVTIETRSRIGSVPAFLGEVAEAIDAQLVAVGTHGPGWVERLFVGSVATSVLRQTARTMLVAPTPPAAERTRLELGVLGQAVFDRPDDWAGALDEFTRRNVGRTARLEVSDPVLGGMVVEATAYRLVGVTFDRHDGALEVMLAGEKDGGHLTHRVRHVRSLELVGRDAREARDGDQGDRALVVEDARGHTVLTFLD
jgi:nucleotide-binding universal stress UspA family protein